MNNARSDYSLIVNVGDAKQLLSLEYSTTKNLGMHYQYYPYVGQPFVSTNFFLNPAWNSKIPTPTDETTWQGVTRRNNLLNLSTSSPIPFDIDSFKRLMGTEISKGGAVWSLTIYQLIVDQNNLDLYVKIRHHSSQWEKIPLKRLFKIDPRITDQKAKMKRANNPYYERHAEL